MVHFLLIGTVLFALDALRTPAPVPVPDGDRRIVVTEGRVRQLAQIFARTWQRPPTAEELQGLIDAFVKEEVYYREAVKLGLDRDDALVRRRMQQKMEFLTEPGSDVLRADEAELRAYLAENRELFRTPPKAAFAQILIREGREAASRALERLRRAPDGADFSAFGAATALPGEMPLTPVGEIARIFGTEFAGALATLPRGEWSGPVSSAYGQHLLRITVWKEAVDPPFEDIRADVERHWRQMRRSAYLRAEYEKLRAKYKVIRPDHPQQALLP